MKLIVYISIIFWMAPSYAGLFGKSHLNSNVEYDIETAINFDKNTNLKKLLKRYKVPERKMNKFFNKATAKRDPNNRSFYQYVRKVLICKPKAVKALIDVGGQPGGTHLRGAFANRCLESANLISSKLPKSVLISELHKVAMPHSFSESVQKEYMDMVTPYIKLAASECKLGNNEGCNAVRAFTDRLNAYDNRYKNTKWRQTLEGKKQTFADQICSEISKENNLKSKISEEREKGEISGFVNATRLKGWGDEAFEYRQKAKVLKQKWRSQYGSPFRNKVCK